MLHSFVRVKELKAFKRAGLQPGQRVEVSFAIPVDMLNFTNMNNQRMVEAGEFEIMVGASSSDIRLKGTVEVVGENRVLDRDWRMESQAHVELSVRCGQARRDPSANAHLVQRFWN